VSSMTFKAIQLSDDQKEAIRTLAAFLKHEFSGKWATQKDLSHLKSNALKALEIAGYVTRHEYENLVAFRLTSKGWQLRHALMEKVEVDCARGDTWERDGEAWTLLGYLPNGVPVVGHRKENHCPHCGQKVED